MKYQYILLLILLTFSCRQKAVETTATMPAEPSVVETTQKVPIQETPPEIHYDYDTTQWFDLHDLDSTIYLELRYATTNNFVKEVMYDCARCFLRREVAKAVVIAHQDLKTQGYGGLIMYDCYRPRPIQWKLWGRFPDPNYVADPRKGSQHNRGGAVDLSIVDKNGKALDMGTDFDFFGEEAHQDYTGHSAEIQANRDLLKATMSAQDFRWIRTEWWHYSYKPKTFEISDMLWSCE
ncbi:MAG: M15 family metallopeptidase [Bacteroidota bacterium]